jgi:hypothetical protein
MTSTKKILIVMDLLRERVIISPKGPSANLDENDFTLVDIEPNEARTIIEKLTNEHKCVYVWLWPETDEKRDVYIDERINEYHPHVDNEKDLARIRRKISNDLVPNNIYNYDLEKNFEDVYKEYQSKISFARIQLEPRSYDAASGLLVVGSIRVEIIAQKRQKGKLKESREAQLMRLLFKDVNSMKDGVALSRVTSVKGSIINAANRKKVKNYITQINKKVAVSVGDKTVPPLIKSNKHAAWINDSYL